MTMVETEDPHQVPAELPRTRKILAQERRLQALEMKKQGHTFREIAETLGYASERTASKAVRKLLEKTEMLGVEDYRNIQIARVEHMLVTLQPKIDAGNERAIETALRLMDKLDSLIGVQGKTVSQGEVRHTISIEVGSGEEDYVARLAALSPRDDRPPIGELPEGMVPNPFLDVVDAEIVEET